MPPGRKVGGLSSAEHPSSRAIAFSLKARRRELGMTLRELAKASGLSAAFLSQAERGLTTPSIISLIHLAKAMDVDVTYFIEMPERVHFIHRARNPQVIEFGSPLRYERLTGHIPNHVMEAILIVVPPQLPLPTVTREGEGFYYILDGNFSFDIGEDTFFLEARDSAHFDQRTPATMLNIGSASARVLWVGTPPLFS